MPIFQVNKVKAGFTAPPRVSNFVSTNLANDLMVLTFAFIDPSKFSAPPGTPDNATIEIEADAFEQLALPRSAFAGWLTQAIRLVSGLGDRDTFGWSEIVRVVSESTGSSTKP
jgi:hypothetical protein